jgi:hypothetical protein
MAYDLKARENWHRWLHLKDRGHLVYMEQAKKCEGMYLGGGLQWDPLDKAVLADEGRPFYEFNQVMPSINAALGHQIRNRMDIAFKPRGGAGDLMIATALSKVVMQVADQNRLHWKETQVYADGLIQQRGYFDVRISFEKNILGEVVVDTLDPLDVAPDDAAKSYDPDDWRDVTVSRWLTLDEIGQRYGQKARDKAKASGDEGPDWGEDDDERERNAFGTERFVGAQDAYFGDGEQGRRYRIIDRQYWVYERTRCLVYPESGDIQIADQMRPEDVVAAKMQGAQEAQLMKKRVYWVVSTYCVTLHEGYSPYEHFTVVPYFAYFRRGITRGMVDNAIDPQNALNKGVSQFIHVVNSSANSGWVVEQNSLTNMDTDELQEQGARTGLVIEFAKGTTAPQKIKPNQVPTGVVDIVDRATQMLKDVTVPDAMRGMQGSAVSGIAKQNDQMASQQQMAVPLDNLAMTRYLLAVRVMKLVQRFYDSHRVFRITETDLVTGRFVEKTLEINRPEDDGSYWNDITIGTYDVVITEQPMAVTFENSQWTQAMEMRKNGIAIPDATVIKYSSLADKQEILEEMGSNPAAEAEADLTKAKAELTRAQSVKLNVEAIYSGIQTAQVIAMNPGVAPLADVVLGSGGYVDKNAAPMLPAPAGPVGQPATNTDPRFPANPAQPASPGQGVREGIETPAADAALTEA